MMKSCIDQCHYHLALASRLFARLDDSHRALEPHSGLKTAGWLIGHLAVTADFARRLCGAEPICPREWRAQFNPGSQPSHDPAVYPPLNTLCETFRAVYDDLAGRVTTADPALLAQPNPYVGAREQFPTARDFVAYLLNSHLAYHLGQLATWCATAGV
jgi:uncharacterized damage-inducible protein DinB